MIGAIAKSIVRNRGPVLAGLAVGGYIWLALWGPQGVRALIEKHKEIRQLQEQNAVTSLENQRRAEHIRRLQNSRSEQEMEIRKQLKLQRPGETTFLLPDAPKSNATGQEAPEQ